MSRQQTRAWAGIDADGESGRGLLLVASLADAWGCEPYPPGGKTVWAECGIVVSRACGPTG